MKVVIKTTNLKLTKDLKEYIESHFSSLERLIHDYLEDSKLNGHFGKPKTELWLEIGKTTQHHKKGKIFRAEGQLRLPYRSIRAEAEMENEKEALIQLKAELEKELTHYKGKLISLTDRRARALKKDLHLAPEARLYRKGRIREEGI